jgi:hypothetical protein
MDFLNVILKRLESVIQQIFQSSMLRNDCFMDGSIENVILLPKQVGCNISRSYIIRCFIPEPKWSDTNYVCDSKGLNNDDQRALVIAFISELITFLTNPPRKPE